jgi:hypothetical protein
MLRAPLPLIMAVVLTATLNAIAASEKSSGKDSEPVRLNRVSFEYAKALIQDGHVVTGMEKPWTASTPSAEEANHFIGKSGWPQYAKWHLGVSESLRETTKHRYKFPFGDFTNVYRSALVAAKTRAAQTHHNDIRDAATELLALIDKQPAVPVAPPAPEKKPDKKPEKKK